MVRSDAPSVTSLLGPDRISVGLEGAGKSEIIDAVVALLDGAGARTGHLDAKMRELIAQTFNHPSVVLWGLGNEVYADEPRLTEAFKTGKGINWGEHCNCLFCGVERFSHIV